MPDRPMNMPIEGSSLRGESLPPQVGPAERLEGSRHTDTERRRAEAANAFAEAAGRALERAYPWGYRSTDSEP